jgi:hypothetical protein
MTDLERTEFEIADIRRQLEAGHPDVEGLCLALMDWSQNKRMIEEEMWNAART